MQPTILWYVLVGLAIGIAAGAVLWWRKRHPGISEYNVRQKMLKEERKAKILELLEERGEITNNQVRDVLQISDATATRYLEELERQQRIEQIGKKGRFVKYRIKH